MTLAVIPLVGIFDSSHFLHLYLFLPNPHLCIECRKLGLCLLISGENQQILMETIRFFFKTIFISYWETGKSAPHLKHCIGEPSWIKMTGQLKQ